MNRRSQGWLTLFMAFLFLITIDPPPVSHAASTWQPGVPQEPVSPFSVGSLIFTEQKITASDGAANDLFGYSVALSGDTALVGAYDRNDGTGAAYVFVRSGTNWVLQAVLTAGDGRAGDRFGIAVALSGDTALIGADGESTSPHEGQGAAYLFTRLGTTWSPPTKLIAGDAGSFDHFGSAVALSGDTALVSAPHDTVGTNVSQGSAYVFTRAGGIWTPRAHLTAYDGAAFDWFGYTVALYGNTALIGVPNGDVDAITDQGSAYVFTRSGETWTPSAKLTVAEGVESDRFGYAVALSDDTALVSSIAANSSQGAAYVFTGSGANWSQPVQLAAAGGADYDHFGWSLSLSGNLALVGARPSNGRRGSAYVFSRSGTAWLQQTQLLASDGTSDDQFANSLALSGNWALVGAPNATASSNDYQGAAYFYRILLATYLPVVKN
jgi:hypothetical protein